MRTATPALVGDAAPNEFRDPAVRAELKRATVWIGALAAVALVVLLIQPLLLIFGGLVFAAMLDGGVRLLGRVLPIGRGWRLLIVTLGVLAFLVGTFWLAGYQIAQQAQQLATTVQVQFARVVNWAAGMGFAPGRENLSSIAQQALGSVGRITTYAMSLFGALTSLAMIMVIGLFVAMEPKLYERGAAWLVPTRNRAEFAILSQRMGMTMRRLMFGRLIGMAVEGVATAVLLAIAGVPMALVLGILTGILAFIPNIGAFISGALMIAVGFSAGVDAGLAAIAIYVAVQLIDGYVIIPMVARRTVDLPPALTLSAQILSGSLLGIMGLALADPLVAMTKVALERRSEREEEQA
ncbi:MAG: AI-2E family transporter [Pseudomonadota bacterium]